MRGCDVEDRPLVHDAVGKSYDGIVGVCGGEEEGGGAVSEEPSIRNVRIVWGMDGAVWWIVVRTPTSFGRFRLMRPRE